MGRIKASQGLEIRPASMRVHFTWQGKRYRPTLTTGGVPMPPTPANIRFAERLAAEVRERIPHRHPRPAVEPDHQVIIPGILARGRMVGVSLRERHLIL